MKNREVYEFSKVLVKILVGCKSDEEQFDLYRNYRKLTRRMFGSGMLSYTQRNYLVGVITKVTKDAHCYEGFYVLEARKYDLNNRNTKKAKNR